MATVPIRLTPARYRESIAELCAAISRDRSKTVSVLDVSVRRGTQVQLFIRHSDLYIVGIDFGAGPYRFRENGESPLAIYPTAKELEFSFDYRSLGYAKPVKGCRQRPLILNSGVLDGHIAQLAHHRPGPNGSDFHIGKKEALVFLVVVTAEAARFESIEDQVASTLASPTGGLDLYSLLETVTNWKTMSKDPVARKLGIRFAPLSG